MARGGRSRRVSAQLWVLAVAWLGLGGAPVRAQSPVVVDLLILYTPAVSASEGGAAATQALAAERVAQINQVFSRSDTNTEIRLVGAIEVPYVESGSIHTDSNRLTALDDGYLDEVTTWRATHDADLVMFIIGTGNVFGVQGVAGFPQPPSLKTRDTYTATVVGFTLWTMTHELGHLFGLNHFNVNADTVRPGDFLTTPTYAAGEIGFGYGPLGGPFHTQLSNSASGGSGVLSTGVPVFSNPRLTEQGAVLGDPVLADAARAIKEAAPMVAAYSETACEYAVSPAIPGEADAPYVSIAVPGSGQSFTYAVTTTPECLTGIRVPDTRWITVDAAPALDARGSGTLAFTVQPNPTSTMRSAMVVMGRSRLRLDQYGSCAADAYVFDSPVVHVPAAPADYSGVTFDFPIGIRYPEGCRVGSPTENASWMKVFDTPVTGHQVVSGDGRSDFIAHIDANMTPVERQVDVSFGGVSVKVVQAAGTCPLKLPGFLLLTASGIGSGVYSAHSGSLLTGDTTGCVASATTPTPWLSFPNGSTVPLTQPLAVQAETNTTGAMRTGSLTINGREIAVYQLATPTTSCTYGVTFPEGVPAAGGAVSMAITTDPGCPWAARSDSRFMSMGAGPVTGTGSGLVPLALAPNYQWGRIAWYGVRNAAHFEQARLSTCELQVSAPSEIPPTGGSGVIAVTTECQWSARVKVGNGYPAGGSHLNVTSPMIGHGDGQLRFTMPATAAYDRTVDLEFVAEATRVATVTITQRGPLGANPGCRTVGTYDLNAPARGASWRLRDFVPTGCRAEAKRTPDASLSSAPAGGLGEDVNIYVGPNGTAAPRHLSLVVNGATIRVSQPTAMTCKYLVAPTFDASQTTLARIKVETLIGCPWSGSTTTAWLSGTPSGTGPGFAEFPVQLDPTRPPRTGTVTVAGQVVTILDAGAPTTGPPTVTLGVQSGSVVPVVPVTTSGPSTLVFYDVTTPGTATLTELSQSPESIAAAPSGLSFLPDRVFDISSTATFESLVVCVTVTTTELTEAGLSTTDPRMLHKPSGSTAWVDVTYSFNATESLLCGRVTSLSPFAIAGTSVAPYTLYLSEGATSTFFDTRFALLNPGDQPDIATLTFSRSSGVPYVHTVAVPPHARVTVDPKTLAGFGSAEFSTTVTSSRLIVVDRTMSWDAADGYGSHAETAIRAPSTTWYLAEGSTNGGFALFYLLQNPASTATAVRVRYLRGTGPPLEKTYALPGKSRTNIWVNVEEFPGLGQALAAADVSAVIESIDGTPIIVERAMYLSNQGRLFNAGHESAGVTAPALSWFLAEGATGPFFDLFVLVANPNALDAVVRVDYLLADGRTFTRTLSAPANSRSNIWVDLESFDGGATHPLANVAVSTTLTSTNGVPIIVERAMWWPGSFSTWYEGHNSAGSVMTGTKWGLAEGEVGGPRATQTYILVANVSAFAGNARVTLMFEDGSSLVKDYPLAPKSRTNVAVGPDFGAAVDNRRFGAVVESTGTTPAEIVVERAMYSGLQWAAGTNALATRLR